MSFWLLEWYFMHAQSLPSLLWPIIFWHGYFRLSWSVTMMLSAFQVGIFSAFCRISLIVSKLLCTKSVGGIYISHPIDWEIDLRLESMPSLHHFSIVMCNMINYSCPEEWLCVCWVKIQRPCVICAICNFIYTPGMGGGLQTGLGAPTGLGGTTTGLGGTTTGLGGAGSTFGTGASGFGAGFGTGTGGFGTGSTLGGALAGGSTFGAGTSGLFGNKPATTTTAPDSTSVEAWSAGPTLGTSGTTGFGGFGSTPG